MRFRITLLAPVLALSFAFACGGEGGGRGGPAIPVADAGDPQSILSVNSVTLDGTRSHDDDGDVLDYLWTQTGGPNATLDDATSATPSFMAPGVTPGMTETLTFELVVNDGANSSQPATVTVTVMSWKTIAVGEEFTVLLRSDGQIFAGGQNCDGQVGQGDNDCATYRGTWNRVGGAEWSEVTAGHNYVLATKTDGSLWFWGNGDKGVGGLGCNTRTCDDTTAPVMVDGGGWSSLTADLVRSAGLKDGQVMVWGQNGTNSVGDPSNTDDVVGSPIGLGGAWLSVAVGSGHTVGIKNDGTVWGWGNNAQGQLGDATVNESAGPISSSTETGFFRAWAGQNVSFAGKGDENGFELWSMGDCENGETGTGSNGAACEQPALTRVGTEMFRAVGSGWNHTFGVTTDGRLMAWGDNAEGKLGDGGSSAQFSPVQVGSDMDWYDAAAGRDTSGALRADGTAWMWGNNSNDSLFGDKNLPRSSNTPLRVANNLQ